MDDVKIRGLETGDYDSYFRLRLESLRLCPEMYATNAVDWENAPRETIERHLQLSESGKAPILGAWVGDELVGLVLLLPDYRPTVEHKATLGGFYVTPGYRRQGIGTMLLSSAVDTAGGLASLKQLRAVVNATGQDAVRLFEKTGFQRYGTEPRAKFIEGVFHDQIYYWYDLFHA